MVRVPNVSLCSSSLLSFRFVILLTCGIASADRRPVDPPPIVELRVYEGEGNAMQDITFAYNANFFLFATLENARVVAQGRVPTTPASFPVLTGTPVAGMAYLDRPNPAGYFIFPDLSVRHEGRYRLSFALYEELKNQNDMDPDDRQTVEVHRIGSAVDAHVSHRLEVKSAPFTVFSAKKFPGLTESTALSRMVAEQGCRVRIRRDVRMRRRDTKSSKEWDDYEDETAFERARRTATPDAYAQQAISTPAPIPESERPRSVSNASNASFAPQRRQSVQDMSQGYQQGYPAPSPQQAPQNGYPTSMQYGNGPSHAYQSQFQPQQQQQPQQQPQPQQQAPNMMQPPQAPYQPAQTHQAYQQPPPQPQTNMQMAPPYGYVSQPQYSQHGYEPAEHMRHNSVEYANGSSDYRRNTLSQPQSSPYSSNQMMAPYDAVNRQSQPAQPQSQQPPQLQPIQTIQPLSQNVASSTPTSTHPITTHALAPLKSLQPLSDRIEPASPSYVTSGQMSNLPDSMHGQQYQQPASKYAPQPQSSTSSKRTFSESFDSKHLSEPLRQGARPSFSHAMDEYLPNFDEGDEEPLDERAMSYRRADGSQRMRRMPIANE